MSDAPAEATATTAPATDHRAATAPLTTAIVRGLRLLGDLRSPHPDVTSGQVERDLRAEIDRLVQYPSSSRAVGAEHPAVAAVRAACAHLATRAYEDAYLALVTARGSLPREQGSATRDPAGT